MKKIMVTALVSACFFGSFCTFASCGKKSETHTRYEITAEYLPESKTITGTVKVTYENVTDSEIDALKFQIYPNAYREDALYSPVSATYQSTAYYKGESYGEMVISSVHGSKNWEVSGEDENILCVDLERSLYPGDKIVLDIAFMTKLASVNHRTGVTEKTVNLGNFFPILCGFKNGGFAETLYYSNGDPFYAECADYKVTLTAPKEYTLVSTGETVEERTLESKKEHTMSVMNARDFAMVLSKEFQVIKVETNGTTLAYYYYEDATPQKSLEVIKESFCFYEETFGAYPYGQYSVAQTGLCMDGMAYPCLAFLSDDLTKEAQTRALAHETAHQWWYGVVGSDQIENAWQDEGLAEYSALAFFEKYEKHGFTREGLVKDCLFEYRSYYDVYGSVLGRTNTRMTRHLKDYISGYEYTCIAYDKAVVMFDTLRKSVGDKKFFEALARYYKTHAYENATVGDLVGSFEKCGLDVSGFFDSFLQGKAIL